MDSVDKTRRWFLFGSIAIGVLVIAGLVYAIVAPGPGSQANTSVTFNDDKNPAIGPADAKVTVRIYSDFQCPACRAADTPLRSIIDKYKDRVQFIWNDFPLMTIHANSINAALAARCAQKQDAFWDYANALYDSQDTWENLADPTSRFIDLASSTRLRIDEFTTCLTLTEPKVIVQNDYNEALEMGLNSTPTFFINKKMIIGAISEDDWSKELNQALNQ